MKNHLRFLYQSLVTSRYCRGWMNTQTVLIFVVSCIFLTMPAWTAPLSVDPTNPDTHKRQKTAVSPLAKSSSHAELGIAQAGEALVVAFQTTPEGDSSPQPTATPFPAEFAYNSQQTFGLTLTATILVLIVVLGVLVYMPRKNE